MGAYTLLQDLTVATNSTSVVLNNFGTITKDDFVKVVVTLSNSSSSLNVLRVTPNSSTSNNFHMQYIHTSGNGIDVSRVNQSDMGFAIGNQTSLIFAYLKLSENDRANFFTNSNGQITSVVRQDFQYLTSSGATFSSGITSLTFTGTQASGIGTGSRIQIYRLDAVKVRDIIVETNSTQVDIPTTGTFDPAIDKDSEYLLVSDVVQGNNSQLYLTPNDLTTLTGYHRQLIGTAGSSSFADRADSPMFAGGASGTTISYAHIKLSNIGAFTFQSYSTRKTGASSIELLNFFGSSTAENITSITKLNIIAAATNGIGAGSRFILYKLYE